MKRIKQQALQKFGEVVRYAKQHGVEKAAVAFGLTVASIEQALAALPTEAAAAFTGMSGNVTDVSAALWPVVAAVISLFFLVKLVKRGANKA